MNKLTQEQKESIYNHGRCLGIDSVRDAQEFILGVFEWESSPQGSTFWSNVYDTYEGFKPQGEIPLTQADIQSLLHIVRDALCDVTYNKRHSSAVAGEYWAKSDKENPDTSVDFNCFSVHNKYTKEMKAKEKKLVHLIKRLKAMR